MLIHEEIKLTVKPSDDFLSELSQEMKRKSTGSFMGVSTFVDIPYKLGKIVQCRT